MEYGPTSRASTVRGLGGLLNVHKGAARGLNERRARRRQGDAWASDDERGANSLFELADLMASNLHCSEALHLDGDLSAFYLPSAPEKFVFADPGERIVTALSVTSN